ncbi:DUF4397 domain-containing protein [Pontibacter sp. SGAir0037]|uniref:DUF4397 domain-containing protein n=1 Tax=Pontibacter sp. SGAir0037 TaxID=2571030 RepID=UPI00143D1A3B|nr:DUF4397 domain-containing protein [Pontibacter sp. SGAir0037]
MNDSEAPAPAEYSYASFYQASPDAQNFNILVNNVRVNNDLFGYSKFYIYQNFTPGTYNFKFSPATTTDPGPSVEKSVSLEKDKVYSIFTIGLRSQTAASGKGQEVLVVEDELEIPATGKAGIRVIHLSPDAPSVDIKTVGTTPNTLFSDVAYKEDTDFMEVNTGNVKLNLVHSETGEVLFTTPNELTLSEKQIYTIIVRGMVTPPANNTNSINIQLYRNYPDR